MSKSSRPRPRDQKRPRLLLAGYQRPVQAGRHRLAASETMPGGGPSPTVEEDPMPPDFIIFAGRPHRLRLAASLDGQLSRRSSPGRGTF